MIKKLIFIFLIFIFGFGLGLTLAQRINNSSYGEDQGLERIQGNFEFPYINHTLDQQPISETSQGKILLLKNRLETYINKQTQGQDADHISVYFRDLNNGPWMGISEKELFSPASLLKIPIMIATYKIAENNPLILSKKIPYMRFDDSVSQISLPRVTLQEGQEYSVEDLVYRMIVYSDNEAKNILVSAVLKEKEINRIYKDLGIELPGIIRSEDFMSVKTYASFFRILYNASYLSKQLSNKALSLLAQSEFKKGIVAGVPENITVANKFGEREIPGSYKQLHDCGIVYQKEKPYILCVMTRGNDWKKLTYVIQDVSRITYTTLTE